MPKYRRSGILFGILYVKKCGKIGGIRIWTPFLCAFKFPCEKHKKKTSTSSLKIFTEMAHMTYMTIACRKPLKHSIQLFASPGRQAMIRFGLKTVQNDK